MPNFRVSGRPKPGYFDPEFNEFVVLQYDTLTSIQIEYIWYFDGNLEEFEAKVLEENLPATQRAFALTKKGVNDSDAFSGTRNCTVCHIVVSL